ncbi:MmcQ/YjbR family DNA-binding protein [Actinospongicola halichondriae]|uniref:MmcQ/YjbR family DNA-binding protein n=1 Tax=Actinospongicola halichondriae TaxID=3236844 RepID=UPI003D583321
MVGPTSESALARLRTICAAFPEVSERPSHGSPTFFVREKKTLVSLHDDHHGDGRLAIWAPAPAGVQEAMVDQDPERFFRPAYVGHLGWVGYRLEDADWDEVAGIVEESFRKVAPKTLVRQYDDARQAD